MAKELEKKEEVEGAVSAPPAWTVSEYDEVVGKAELIAVRAHEVKFKVKPSYFNDGNENQLGYGIDVIDVKFDSERGLAAIEIAAEVTVKYQGKKVLIVNVGYNLMYVGLEDRNGNAAEAFLRRVGTFTCWPYFRTLVSSLDWSAGTGLPMLPVLREKVLPAKRKREEDPG